MIFNSSSDGYSRTEWTKIAKIMQPISKCSTGVILNLDWSFFLDQSKSRLNPTKKQNRTYDLTSFPAFSRLSRHARRVTPQYFFCAKISFFSFSDVILTIWWRHEWLFVQRILKQFLCFIVTSTVSPFVSWPHLFWFEIAISKQLRHFWVL